MLVQGESTALAIMIPAFLGIVTVVVGFGKMLTSHIGDTEHHPDVSNLVTKENCEVQHETVSTQEKALINMMGLIEKHNQERHEDLKCYMKKLEARLPNGGSK